MVKILSRSGTSLADTYDVVGSVAGIEQLESREVSLVHEMGQTLFSERFSTFMRRGLSGAILQNVTFNFLLNDLPSVPFRILGIAVFSDAIARVAMASVALRDPVTGREIPIWAWDAVIDPEMRVRHEDDGGGVVQAQFLRPLQPLGQVPHLTAGSGQPQRVPDVAFRGASTGFGAGTVSVTMLLHIGFSQTGGISSHGLPIPSW